ncbi:hypothetical protein [Candidatus Nanohalovita haloferacivicina]|uniref:hypothetical protein n=1 Tax=Candidatus Nanohalovita haloferacivicina TaxID=2978046 RepID=UPI00325FD41B|nr:hypothetical protein HBNXNv_0368 [Candidatus Nanohalobia archaeon BNXNv]
MNTKLKEAILRGLSASVFSAVATYLGLRAWITLSISVGPVTKLYSLVDAATVLAAVLAFFTTALASYTSMEE